MCSLCRIYWLAPSRLKMSRPITLSRYQWRVQCSTWYWASSSWSSPSYLMFTPLPFTENTWLRKSKKKKRRKAKRGITNLRNICKSSSPCLWRIKGRNLRKVLAKPVFKMSTNQRLRRRLWSMSIAAAVPPRIQTQIMNPSSWTPNQRDPSSKIETTMTLAITKTQLPKNSWRYLVYFCPLCWKMRL